MNGGMKGTRQWIVLSFYWLREDSNNVLLHNYLHAMNNERIRLIEEFVGKRRLTLGLYCDTRVTRGRKLLCLATITRHRYRWHVCMRGIWSVMRVKWEEERDEGHLISLRMIERMDFVFAFQSMFASLSLLRLSSYLDGECRGFRMERRPEPVFGMIWPAFPRWWANQLVDYRMHWSRWELHLQNMLMIPPLSTQLILLMPSPLTETSEMKNDYLDGLSRIVSN